MTEPKTGRRNMRMEKPGSRAHTWWYSRPTIRTLKREAEEQHRCWAEDWDTLANAETRLPSAEGVSLGGIVLVEAFTPSTVSALYKVLESLGGDRAQRRQQWIEELTRSRRGAYGGWQNLGFICHPGDRLLAGDGYHDATLPKCVSAVWLRLDYVAPSVAMVVGTFTLKDEVGDLSGVLRESYSTHVRDLHVRVYGKAARLRERIPWARPAHHGLDYGVVDARSQKQEACADIIQRCEQECADWFSTRFPGRFAANELADRPVVRILFTRESVPFQRESPAWLQPAGLSYNSEVWRADPSGWALCLSSWPYRYESENTITVAARRGDVVAERSAPASNDSTSYHMQQFGDQQAALVARYAAIVLLSTYSNGIGDLRDRAGFRRILHRTVHDARKLDRHLIGDGLDAATVTTDLRAMTNDLHRFRWGLAEYSEDLAYYSESFRAKNPPRELVAVFFETLKDRATRLADDTAATTASIRASADLRQSMANTRLQRATLLLSLIAAAVAIISLVAQSK
jgi:hypothetical protein